MTIPITPPAKPGTYWVAVSMVQDGVAWFHSHGLDIPISVQSVTVDKNHIAHVSDGRH